MSLLLSFLGFACRGDCRGTSEDAVYRLTNGMSSLVCCRSVRGSAFRIRSVVMARIFRCCDDRPSSSLLTARGGTVGNVFHCVCCGSEPGFFGGAAGVLRQIGGYSMGTPRLRRCVVGSIMDHVCGGRRALCADGRLKAGPRNISVS